MLVKPLILICLFLFIAYMHHPVILHDTLQKENRGKWKIELLVTNFLPQLGSFSWLPIFGEIFVCYLQILPSPHCSGVFSYPGTQVAW